jgi:hypothetical protein
MSAVEQAAAALAPIVRAEGWNPLQMADGKIGVYDGFSSAATRIFTLHCQDASQAKRLASMMRGKA